MTKQEQEFVQSIKNKIKNYNIETTLKLTLNEAAGKFVYTQYNDGTTEIVDVGCEWYLCSTSPLYFIAKYGWIDLPGTGTIPFHPYYFQKETLKLLPETKKTVYLKSRQCLRDTSFVKTKDRGLISIKDVKPGDFIETFSNDKITYTLVENFYNQGEKEIVRILINSGQAIECTLDHKILTKEGWKEAQKLTLEDEIVSSIGKGKFGTFKLERDEFAALIGYYLADGSYNKPCFVNTNKDYANEVLEAGELFENCSPYIHIRKENRKTAYDVRLVSTSKNPNLNRPIKNFLSKYNLNTLSINRNLTPDLLDLNKHQMSILLNRLYAGNGWITYTKDKRKPNYIRYEIGFGSSCFSLIKQIEYILQTKYGIHCWINHSLFKGSDFWKLRITQKKSVIKFVNEIGIKGKTDTSEIVNLIAKEKPYNSHQSYEKIRKIEVLEEKGVVYDITTTNNNFLTNGLMVHNCGISTLTSLYCLWRGNFKRSENIDVISTKQQKAQAYVSKMDATIRMMPDFLKTPVVNKNSSGVKWDNGSVILSETASDRAGRGDSLSLLILDEAAHYMTDRLTRGIIAAAMPTLARTGGSSIIISCLTKDTYIFTNKGIQQIEDFIPQNWEYGHNKIEQFKIDGLSKRQNCNDFYISGFSDTLKITTNSGFEIEGTPIHPLMVFTKDGKMEWKKLKDLEIGDNLVIKANSQSFGNFKKVNFFYNKEVHNGKDLNIKEIDKEIAYLFGIYLSEGYIYTDRKKQYKLQIAVTENDIKNKIMRFAQKYNFHVTKGKTVYTISSKGLIKFFEYMDFDIYRRSSTKIIPKKLLQMPKDLMIEMLKGMYDGDGCNNYRAGSIDYASKSNELIKQLKIILLNFGIQTKISQNKKTKVFSLLIHKDREKFLKRIGFSLLRKQNYLIENVVSNNRYEVKDLLLKEAKENNISLKLLAKEGCDLYIRKTRKNGKYLFDTNILKAISIIKSENLNELEQLIKEDYILEKIQKIEKSQNLTYDFTIPETHSFIANGIISSNTPNGTSGSGAYYYEQVNMLQINGSTNNEKLVEIDWFEVPDIPGIKPYKGFNEILNKYIKQDYFNKPSLKEQMRKYFAPIAENWRENEWLRKSHEDLGDVLFKQEVLHSFIIGEDQVFPEEVLEKVRESISTYKPIWENKLNKMPIKGMLVWELPKPKHRYIIGVDVGTGTSKDYSSIEVMDVDNYEQVAEYKGKMSTKLFGRLVKIVANYYNQGFVVIEANSIGEAVFNEVYYHDTDPYDNVYKQKKVKNGITRMTGWETNVKTRQLMTNNIIDWFTVDELYNTMKIKSQRLYQELCTWVWHGPKPEHAEGSHDDNLIAWGLCLYLRNKADSFGESFFIGDDGSMLEFNKEDSRNIKVDEDTFSMVINEYDGDSEKEKLKEQYGVENLDQYKWLIGS